MTDTIPMTTADEALDALGRIRSSHGVAMGKLQEAMGHYHIAITKTSGEAGNRLIDVFSMKFYALDDDFLNGISDALACGKGDRGFDFAEYAKTYSREARQARSALEGLEEELGNIAKPEMMERTEMWHREARAQDRQKKEIYEAALAEIDAHNEAVTKSGAGLAIEADNFEEITQSGLMQRLSDPHRQKAYAVVKKYRKSCERLSERGTPSGDLKTDLMVLDAVKESLQQNHAYVRRYDLQREIDRLSRIARADSDIQHDLRKTCVTKFTDPAAIEALSKMPSCKDAAKAVAPTIIAGFLQKAVQPLKEEYDWMKKMDREILRCEQLMQAAAQIDGQRTLPAFIVDQLRSAAFQTEQLAIGHAAAARRFGGYLRVDAERAGIVYNGDHEAYRDALISGAIDAGIDPQFLRDTAGLPKDKRIEDYPDAGKQVYAAWLDADKGGVSLARALAELSSAIDRKFSLPANAPAGPGGI